MQLQKQTGIVPSSSLGCKCCGHVSLRSYHCSWVQSGRVASIAVWYSLSGIG